MTSKDSQVCSHMFVGFILYLFKHEKIFNSNQVEMEFLKKAKAKHSKMTKYLKQLNK